jgi:uncharacterized protein YkwD
MARGLAAAAVYIVLIGAVVVGGSAALIGVSDDPGGSARADRINESAVEAAMHARLNELRRDRGVGALPHQPEVSAQATAWSDRMANGTYEHSPRGYYQCRAAENIATLPAYGDVELRTGEIKNYHGNETAIGHALVGVWNRSPPHRENMLDRSHSAHAPGIAVAERNGTVEVYATQAFCSPA